MVSDRYKKVNIKTDVFARWYHICITKQCVILKQKGKTQCLAKKNSFYLQNHFNFSFVETRYFSSSNTTISATCDLIMIFVISKNYNKRFFARIFLIKNFHIIHVRKNNVFFRHTFTKLLNFYSKLNKEIADKQMWGYRSLAIIFFYIALQNIMQI